MVSVEQALPNEEAFLVEYPGFVRDSHAALDTLGGAEAVAATARGNASLLPLRFRRGDPLSHPLLGDKQATKGLLLKLTCRAGEPPKPGPNSSQPGGSQPGVAEESNL
jgi:hypothetical protein